MRKISNFLTKQKILPANLLQFPLDKLKSEMDLVCTCSCLNLSFISLKFSPKEFAIIKLLIENKGRLVEREKLAEKIWGAKWEDKYSDWAIDRLIYRLRNKMKKIGIDYKLLKTLKTRGIIFG